MANFGAPHWECHKLKNIARRVVSIRTMMDMLDCGKTTAHKLIKNKAVRSVKIGRSRRVDYDDIIEVQQKGVAD